MAVTATSTPNIALIKYWGNRNDALRLPAADSLSITLDQPSVEITIDHEDHFAVRSFLEDGLSHLLTERQQSRLANHLQLVKKYLATSGSSVAFPASVSLEIRSKIPPGVGLASSAAIFSALAEGYAALLGGLTKREISIMARLGSGSASRSVFGGFVAMIAGEGNKTDAAYAEQIAPEDHWKLWDIIIVPAAVEKETGSTEGHALAHTSPFFEQRMSDIPARQKMCIEAIREKDFEKLTYVAEKDCLDMHTVMLSSTPPLHYLSKETHRIIREVENVRRREHLSVLYTMDAGPTVHLICDETSRSAIRAYADAQRDCAIFEAGIGKGSAVIH